MRTHTGSNTRLTGPSAAGPRAAAAAVTCLLAAGMLVVSVGNASSGEPGGPPAAAAAAGAGNGRAFSAYFRKLTRERRAISGPRRRSVTPGPVEALTPADLFIAVKTTGRYHRQRLDLLLETWISTHRHQVGLHT